MMSRTVDDLLAALRGRGGRITSGRRFIIELLVATDEPLSAEEIVEAAQRVHPEFHPSTAYRTLESLEEAGLIEHVHLGHSAARWQLANSDQHHLVCQGCGAVQLVPREVFAAVQERVRADHGFEIAFQHFATMGRCARCRNRTGTD